MPTFKPSTTLTGTIEVAAGQTLIEPGPTTIGVNESFGPTVEGAGTFETDGTTTLATQSDSGIYDLAIGDGLTWVNNGIVEDGGSVSVGLANGDTNTIINSSGATFDFLNDSAISEQLLTSGVMAAFNNAGLLVKSGGTGTSVLGVAINNTGTIEVEVGNIAFDDGGLLSGSVEGASGATVAFDGGTFTLANASIAATLVINDATVRVQTPTTLADGVTASGGMLDIGADTTIGAPFTATRGNVALGSGDALTLNGPTTFGADEFSPNVGGPGSLITTGLVNVPAQSGGAVGMRIGDGLSWTNTGTVTVATSIDYGLTASDTSTFTNETGATLLFQNGAGFVEFLGVNATATITNAGVLDREGTGGSTIGASIINTGTVTAISGELILAGAVSGSGSIELGVGVTLDLGSSVSGQTVSYEGAGELILGDATSFAASETSSSRSNALAGTMSDDRITGLQAGDRIVLQGETITGATLSGATLAVDLVGGDVLDLQVAGPAQADQVTVSGDEITIACFAAGTRLRTVAGYCLVEHLTVGDFVVTHTGAERAVVWIGHRRVWCAARPNPAKVNPVRVQANAFGPGVPARDVMLSPDHAVFANDGLIPIHLLVNGDTIRQEAVDSIKYFHVELASHDVILAENLPVETYIDTGNRAMFANAPLVRLDVDFSRPSPARTAFPMVLNGPKLDEIRAELEHRRVDGRRALAG